MAGTSNMTIPIAASHNENCEVETQDVFKADGEISSALVAQSSQAAGSTSGFDPEYPEGLALLAVVIALTLSIFLIALDMVSGL